MKLFLSTFILLFFTSCHGQEGEPAEIRESIVYSDADIVTSSLMDKNENLWFGTSTEGLYKYDGEKLSDLTFLKNE
jgi:ligand-binding sensor domain-containing protein